MAVFSARDLMSQIKYELTSYRVEVLPMWITVGKIAFAALLALWVAYRLNFDQPQWSVITVFITSVSSNGVIPVITKGVYRIAGTLMGALLAVLLMSLFAQQPALYLITFSLVIGACAGMACFYRGFQGYFFRLSGYTAAVIGFSSAFAPQHVFAVAIARCSEVMLGILCVSLVSMIVLPQNIPIKMLTRARQSFFKVMEWSYWLCTQQKSVDELEQIQQGFVAEAILLDTQCTGSLFERPTAYRRYSQLRRLCLNLLNLSNASHAFMQNLARFDPGHPIYERFKGIQEKLGYILHPDVWLEASDVHKVLSNLKHCQKELNALVPQTQLSEEDVRKWAYLMHSFRRMLDELQLYVQSYEALIKPCPLRVEYTPVLGRHVDALQALLFAARSTLSLLIVSAFWVYSGWVAGVSALITAATFSALYSERPNPVKSIKRRMVSFVIGCLIGSFIFFITYGMANGFETLAILLFPAFLVFAWLLHSSFDQGGFGFLIGICTSMPLANQFGFNLEHFVNQIFASVLGIAVAGIVFSILPLSSVWVVLRLKHHLQKSIHMACFASLKNVHYRLSTYVNDVLYQMISNTVYKASHSTEGLRDALAILEVGRVVIRMRKTLAELTLSYSPIQTDFKTVRVELSALYRQGKTHRQRPSLDLALQRFRQVLCALIQESPELQLSEEEQKRYRLLEYLAEYLGTLIDDYKLQRII